MRAVLAAWRTNQEPDVNDLDDLDIASGRRTFEVTLGLRSSDLTADEIDLLRPRSDEVIDGLRPGGSWRKIHDALFTGPAGEPIVSLAATRIALYLVRDPRDVVVSLAHHVGQTPEWVVARLGASGAELSGRPGGLDIQLRQRLGSWSDHVRSWVDQTSFPVHVVRYEDCIAHPLTTFATAFRAGGLEVDDDELRIALERSSLGRLQAQEAIKGFQERPRNGGPFFRRGAAGGWINELPTDLARRVEADHREVMVRFGYLAP